MDDALVGEQFLDLFLCQFLPRKHPTSHPSQHDKTKKDTYCGGATSTKYNGLAEHASCAKKLSRNLPPIKVGSVLAVDVTTVPTITPAVPMKMSHRRPSQSATQTKSAAHIWPIWKMAKMMPVLAVPVLGRL